MIIESRFLYFITANAITIKQIHAISIPNNQSCSTFHAVKPKLMSGANDPISALAIARTNNVSFDLLHIWFDLQIKNLHLPRGVYLCSLGLPVCEDKEE